jgi:hypothetical protein
MCSTRSSISSCSLFDQHICLVAINHRASRLPFRSVEALPILGDACGWQRRSYDVPAYSSDTRSRRVEQLWLFPPVLGRNPAAQIVCGPGLILTGPGKSAERVLMAAIRRLRLQDERVTISAVASMASISREHVSRSIGTSSSRDVWVAQIAFAKEVIHHTFRGTC